MCPRRTVLFLTVLAGKRKADTIYKKSVEMSMRNFRILSKNYSSGKFVFCAGELVGKSACQRLRRGTFSTREKYPKARQKPSVFWRRSLVPFFRLRKKGTRRRHPSKKRKTGRTTLSARNPFIEFYTPSPQALCQRHASRQISSSPFSACQPSRRRAFSVPA